MLQFTKVIDVRRSRIAVDHHQDSQSNSNFGSCNGHDEKNKNLSGAVAAVSRKSNKQQINSIQHQFNAHEDNDGISPEHDTEHTDAEQHGAEE